jgi:hypothetical protein
LPVGFILGDLAITLLGFPIRVAHCLPSPSNVELP